MKDVKQDSWMIPIIHNLSIIKILLCTPRILKNKI